MNTKEKLFVPIIDDLLFKESLGHQDNVYFVEYLLETFLHLKRGSLHNKLTISYESPLEKKSLAYKSMRNDLLITFDGFKVNLEAYTTLTFDSILKSSCYAFSLVSNVDIGADYLNLDNTIQLNFIYKVNKKDILPDKIKSNYEILEDTDLSKLIQDKLKIRYYRIDKLQTKNYNEISLEEKFLAFFGAQSFEERKKIAKGDELFMEFNDWVNNYVNGDNFKLKMQVWGERNAHKLGAEEERECTARSMLNDGVSYDKIAKYTRLSKDEIIELAKDN